MQLRLSLTLGMIAFSLVGCARFSISNHSLDYKKTQAVAPLNVPADVQMRPQQALYPAPVINPQALQQAPNFSNAKGNRFEMPRPDANTAPVSNAATGVANTQPQFVTDGNNVPLLKIDGNAETVWKYVVAAASTANLNATDGKTPYQLSVQYEGKTYILRLSPTGTSNVLGVYQGNSNFAPTETAHELLNLIAQNWPA
ncbi:lipoprotein-34 precursor (NlpB) [Acinetobacter qingfengensis]|uniref:Uncharacterized protein n=1 Tax=Acinetobacter qingfengensis TaxID=1262585 RepID=A0A1E7R4Y2_9GAMM|nr:hypothetical protein [Acinetobacter qingfengensis]KAA8732371.1 lipoprotein-34 precursor (NlpB) [Acinetobacter qingfengensis]OEY94366.1 hypothetical protein BJI46_03215 [Acinetobacter qingfengensis]